MHPTDSAESVGLRKAGALVRVLWGRTANGQIERQKDRGSEGEKRKEVGRTEGRKGGWIGGRKDG